MADTSVPLPISEVARRVSGHLDALAAEVFAIEHAIGDELGQNSPIAGDYLKRLQRLDFLRQSLEDLAMLNLIISDHCKGELSDDVGHKLRLASTKELLANRAVAPLLRQPDDCIGDVDLF